jgi:hypothetical protein
MRRAELRGFDWAGMKLSVEVPESIDPERDWVLPDGLVPLAQHDFVADLQISLDGGADDALAGEGTTWFHEGDVFEAGRIGTDHWIRRLDDGRVALADPSFRFVHVSLPTDAREAGFPLAHPLDDLVLIHRALQQGAFALRATAVVEDGDALVVMGDADGGQASRGAACWKGWLLLRATRGGIRVAPLPSTLRSGRTGQNGRTARLAGLHVVDPMSCEGDVVRVLDADSAAAEMLRYAFSPIACGEADRLVGAATALARRVPVVQLQSPGCDRFAWNVEESMLRRMLPAGA